MAGRDRCGGPGGRCHRGALYTPHPDAQGTLLTGAFGRAAEALPQYLGHWIGADPWIEAVERTGRFKAAGEVLVGRELIPSAGLRRTPFYNDFLRHFELEDMMAVKVCGDSDAVAPPTQFTLFRPAGSAPFGDAEMAFLRAVWPHLERAVQNYWLLRKAAAADHMAESALDALPLPAWIVRIDGTLDYANAAARQLMAPGRWVHASVTGLKAIGDLDLPALRQALAPAVAGGALGWRQRPRTEPCTAPSCTWRPSRPAHRWPLPGRMHRRSCCSTRPRPTTRRTPGSRRSARTFT